MFAHGRLGDRADGFQLTGVQLRKLPGLELAFGNAGTRHDD
jgi:hypothetical protein